MNTEVLKSIYKSIRGNIGLLTENNEIIKNILGTDLTIVEEKGKQFLLVPLNSKHKFNYYEDGLDVDGQFVKSTMYWQEDGCQYIEIQDKDTLSLFV